jgi:hypothetical protein
MSDPNVKVSEPTAAARGVFIHSDGSNAVGIQLSGGISQLEAYALLTIVLARMENTLNL